ncbi:hypothetical protein K2173_015018 [Erythroxylum novogranatense]|uniref:VQ domain-containing protein n=1 Tax=Erythroxylum novogranatense TaxID=1862640 RepID=A0AAV8TWJ1_9ROSI|nr:hypothetical protein K2173_015018 [Erythroxylum novogranatense]
MTSSENLASVEPWMSSRPAFPDSLMLENYVRDAQTITKALQKSHCGNSTNVYSSSASVQQNTTNPNVSTVSGFDPDKATRRQRTLVTGRISKRKSRALKRSQTTFIPVDPENFRQMVQQVTGVGFGNYQMPMMPVLKPEPQRLGERLKGCGAGAAAMGYLPTLDTSAVLLDHHQQQMVMGSTTGSGIGPVVGSGSVVANVGGSWSGSGSGLDFDISSNF